MNMILNNDLEKKEREKEQRPAKGAPMVARGSNAPDGRQYARTLRGMGGSTPPATTTALWLSMLSGSVRAVLPRQATKNRPQLRPR